MHRLKIARLAVENIRGINLAVLENLGDVVVIAGANGCGKSCLLDCVRLFKSQYGSYDPNEPSLWWQEKSLSEGARASVIKVLRQKDRQGSITASIQLEAQEKEFIEADAARLTEGMAVHEMFPNYHRARRVGWWNWRGDPQLVPYRAQIEQRTQEISADIRRELANSLIQGSVSIRPDGVLSIAPNHALTYIFSTFEPDSLGVIDFHAADRSYVYEDVSNVNIKVDAKDAQWRSSAMYNLSQKYSNIKSALATEYIISMLASQAGVPGRREVELIKTLQDIFTELIPGKSFKGPAPTSTGQLEFPVETDGAEHDLNELSSGEKEVVFGYLRTRARAARNSVIIVDEPELHLNPGMIEGLPKLYQRHIGQALNNQVWLVTHSDVFLRSAFNDTDIQLFHMAVATREPSTNQISPISQGSEFDRTCIDMIGDVANYRPGQPVLIVEGQLQFDILVLQRLFAEEIKGVNVLEAGGKDQVRQRHSALREAADRDGRGRTILSVTDSDGKHDPDEGNGRFQWPAYHIENYLLHPRYIGLALDSLSAQPPGTTGTRYVERMLKESKDEAVTEYLRRRFVGDLRSRLSRNLRYMGNSENLSVQGIQEQLTAYREAVGKDLEAMMDPKIITKNLEDHQAEIAELQQASEVPATLPGRQVLAILAQSVLPRGDYITMRNAILNEMARDGFQPPEMKAVLDRCLTPTSTSSIAVLPQRTGTVA